MTLSAAVMAAVLSSYLFLGRQLARLAHQQTLETEARRTLGTFTQDVRKATGLVTVSTSPTSPSASRVDLTVPTTAGTSTVTYYYNSGSATPVTINTTSVTMPATSLTRCVDDGTTVTSLTLLNNITSNGLEIHYYDSSGNEYETATLAAGSYLPGIKQLSLEFSTQTGTADSGTQTPIHQVSSSRLALRNRSFLQ